MCVLFLNPVAPFLMFQQVQGDAEMRDGSFVEAPTADAAKPSGNMTGKTFNIA